MPERKTRLPLQKVRVYQNLNTNLYYHNRRKLGFLPKLFLYLMLAIIIASSLWYFNLLNVQAFFSQDLVFQTIKLETPAALVLKTEAESRSKNPDQPTQPTSPATTNNTQTILINNEAGLPCYLEYSSTNTAIKPIIHKNPTGWWLPANCAYSKLQAIQIVRLTDSEVQDISRQINPANLQNLDGIDTYALAYTHNRETLPYNLARYIKSLTLPVYQDRFYFSTSAVFETKRIGRFTYYLDGNCQGAVINDPCKLWRSDNHTGTIELLKKNVGLTGKGEANELKEGFVLKFATRQDYAEGINLIFLNQQTGNYKLLRVSQTNWQVFETWEILKTDSLYSVYYL